MPSNHINIARIELPALGMFWSQPSQQKVRLIIECAVELTEFVIMHVGKDFAVSVDAKNLIPSRCAELMQTAVYT